MNKRILVPLEGSQLSEAVLPHAAEIARALGAELVLLYVVPGPAPEFSLGAPAPGLKAVQGAEAETKRYLKVVCRRLEADGLRVSYIVRSGTVAETILEAAELMHTGMIAMSTHGRSGAQRLLLGSVTDQVVHACRLPMLVIRPDFGTSGPGGIS